MCSVVGGFVSDVNSDALDLIETLYDRSLDRGSDAVGLFHRPWDSGEEETVFIHQRGDDVSDKGQVPPQGPYTFLGCFRGEPTTEWHGNTTWADIQPFTVGDWTVVHNGTIANDKALREECRTTSEQEIPTETDTWTIAYVLSRYGWQKGIAKLTGSFAILAVNRRQPTRIYYAVNYKPLYVFHDVDSGAFLFGSQASYFDTDGHAALNKPSPMQVEPYTYGWYDYDTAANIVTVHKDTLYDIDVTTQGRVLMVCSGGLDSTVAAWSYHARGYEVDLLHFRYECRAEVQEVTAVYDLSVRLGGKVIDLPMNFFLQHANSTLTDPSKAIAQGESGAEFAHEWVPARNTVFIALAVAYAEANGYDIVGLGTNQEESCGGYPDNEQEFVNKWNDLIPFAVKPYVKLRVDDPLGGMMKHEIVTHGTETGAPFHISWSCYEGTKLTAPFAEGLTAEGRTIHCGTCGPCTMRKRAFQMAKISDPTEYAA